MESQGGASLERLQQKNQNFAPTSWYVVFENENIMLIYCRLFS